LYQRDTSANLGSAVHAAAEAIGHGEPLEIDDAVRPFVAAYRRDFLELAFDLGDLGTFEGLRRLLEIAVADGLALEPGVGRLRVILAATEQARRLLETADLAARVEMLEAVARREQPAPPTTKYPEGLLLESDR
jgi:hypothetical protein